MKKDASGYYKELDYKGICWNVSKQDAEVLVDVISATFNVWHHVKFKEVGGGEHSLKRT